MRSHFAAAFALVALLYVSGDDRAVAAAPPPAVPAPPNAADDALAEEYGRMSERAADLERAADRAHKAAAKETPEECARRVVAAVLEKAGQSPESVMADLRAYVARRGAAKTLTPLTPGAAAVRAVVWTAYRRRDPTLLTEARARGIDPDPEPLFALAASLIGRPDAERARALVDALADGRVPDAEAWGLRLMADDADPFRASRHAARRLAAPPPVPPRSEFATDQLRSLASAFPPPSPTDPDRQGTTGRLDPELGYLPPRPEKLPVLAPGQRFLCLPDDRLPLSLTDAQTGKPVSRAAVALRRLTLTAAESPSRLRFALEGYPNPVEWRGPAGKDAPGGLYDLPGLYPLVEDATLRRLRARYEGRKLWGYGGVGVESVMEVPGVGGGFEVGAETAVTVRRIYRLRAGRPFVLPIGTSPGYRGERASVFATRDPLVVVLDVPANARPSSMAYSAGLGGGGGDSLDEAMKALEGGKTPRAIAHYALFGDDWDFEREFTPVPRSVAARKWPPRLRRAATRSELVKGMTPEMVAWVMGWPGEYGTRAALTRLKTWRYDDIPPHRTEVYFKNGRVSGWHRAQLP